MAFFQFMGNSWYQLKDGSKVLMNDITVFANFSDVWKKDATVQIKHKIKDGELPHSISNKLYDTVEYWWTILLINNIYDFDNQWPRTYAELNDYMDAKYPGKLRSDVHHYRNPQGLVADLLSLRVQYGLTDDNQVINLAGLEPVSIEEFEIGLNDHKRNIVLVDPDYISRVQIEYEKAMSSGE
jgi:hypothetical protein